MTLLTNLCGFTYPGRKFKPAQTDKSEFAELFRLKRGRDNIKHKPKLSVSDQRFYNLFAELTPSLLALGVNQDTIDNIKTMKIRDKVTRAQIAIFNKMKESLKSFNFNSIPPVDNFFSRENEIDDLHKKLIASFRSKFGVVLHGFPGLGKSETARKYWKKYGKCQYDDIVVWINAESVTTMENQFKQIADRCGLEDKITNPDGKLKSSKEIVDIVYRFFASGNNQQKVLFVFDGADKQDILFNFLPQAINDAPYILITSQITT